MSFDEVRTQAVLTLFEEAGEMLKFPDVDAAILATSSAELAKAKEAVARAERALDEARGLLRDQQQSLQQLAARGLAYARIYADTHAAVRERMDELLGGEGPSAASKEPTVPKRRGRPKSNGTPPLLRAELDEAPREVA
ncbi:MAG: hypothetical protein U1E65_10745 [Myxococcota bacterium]